MGFIHQAKTYLNELTSRFSLIRSYIPSLSPSPLSLSPSLSVLLHVPRKINSVDVQSLLYARAMKFDTRSKPQMRGNGVSVCTCASSLVDFWLDKTPPRQPSDQCNFAKRGSSNWFRALGTVLFQSKEKFSRLIAAWRARCRRNFINCVKRSLKLYCVEY